MFSFDGRNTRACMLSGAIAALMAASHVTGDEGDDSSAMEQATDAAGLKTLPGFRVDLLYSVPITEQGSWVSMTVDPRGRLIVCDQYGGLYRVTLRPPGQPGVAAVEEIDVEIGGAQGLLYAFDKLYVMVNKGADSGLYQVTDRNRDDQFDTVTLLQKLSGKLGEHGPHAIVPSPDKRSLYVVAGNNTLLPNDIKAYRLPKNWGEDQLLPRDPCSNGHNTGRLAPGGWVCRVSPDGKDWELVAAGFRNPYGIAFNRDDELFTYDADMEMDVGTPWYRPTRVCHVVSGGEFGWRWGTGKWPEHSPDSLPGVVDIGQGSPTGVTFGYGANFPSVYQNALYVCDWTYGRLFAVHLMADGASYRGRLEEFITGTPLPLTDILVNPIDQAMYFTIGGRRTQSGLYRVTWVGGDPANHLAVSDDRKNDDRKNDDRKNDDRKAAQLRQIRRDLEVLHAAPNPDQLDFIWTHLSHPDRHIRYASRIALEHLQPSIWSGRAVSAREPDAAICSLLALARCGDSGHAGSIADGLLRVATEQTLDDRQMVDLLRGLGVTFARHGRPSQQRRAKLVDVLQRRFSSRSRSLNHELCRMLVYLESSQVVRPAVEQMSQSVTQEDLLAYGMTLRVATRGWTDALSRAYFSLLNKLETGAATHDFVGGGHLQIYTQRVRTTATERLTERESQLLDDVIHARLASTVPSGSPTPRKFVRNWTVEDVLPHLERVGVGRSFENGEKMFTVANCVQCHRFQNTGGVLGPDITGAAGRYSRAIMVREILQPSLQMSDQFLTHVVITTAGRVYEGRITNRTESKLVIAADPRHPQSVVEVATGDVEQIVPSKQSMMPKDLLNTLTIDDILDLLAFIESGGDAGHANFAR